MNEWKRIIKIREHHIAKNKNLEAILITKENAKKISDEYRVFSVFNEATLLIGVMSFQRTPVWMICINPKSHKSRRYIFETPSVFKRNFRILKED